MNSGSWLTHTFRALRHRDYRLYFIGQTVSLIGTWAQNAAMSWLAAEMTHTSTWPALITAAGMLPTFVLGVWGGGLADRRPKRDLILTTQALFLVLAALLAGLALAGVIRPWHMLLIALGNGIVTAVDLPARLAFVTDLVGRDDLINAVALNSVLFNVARALGPASAGLLIHVFSPAACFLMNALSYVGVLVALAMVRTTGPPRPGSRPRGLGATTAAVRYLLLRPRLLLVMLLAFALCLFAWPFQALLARLSAVQFDSDHRGYALMVSAVGWGALLGALGMAALGTAERRRLFLGGGLVLTVAGLLGLSLADSLTQAGACCALLGFGLIAFMANAQAAVQLGAAEHNRGQVLGLWSMGLSGALPLGNLLGGLSADVWGEPLVLRAQAVLCAVAALLLVLWLDPGRGTLPDPTADEYDTLPSPEREQP
jgi:MFS family permease